MTWPVLIMPFIEQGPLYKRFDVRLGFTQQPADARTALVPIFFCPSRRQPMISPASQNGGPNGNLEGACGDYGCCSTDGLQCVTQQSDSACGVGGLVCQDCSAAGDRCYVHLHALQPPSITFTVPVVKEDSSLAR